jgi:GNAT superfamily N-acetyltransferase
VRNVIDYDPDMDERTARESWMVGPPGRTVVAVAADGTVIGSANMYANREGGGGHIASASFMVDPAHHGQGAGRALGEDALDWARASGFHGMQFNAVVESNTRAVGLWRRLASRSSGRSPTASAIRPRATSACT